MKVSLEFTPLQINADAFNVARIKTILLGEAHNTLQRQISNMQQGVGMTGEPIKASGYSPGYKAAIQAGRVPGKAPSESETVNLRARGDLYRSIQVGDIQNGARIYINGADQTRKAQSLLDRGFRGWFGMGPIDVERATKAVNEQIKAEGRTLLIR